MRAKRGCFDEERRSIFMDIYNNADGGLFKMLLSDKSNSKNYEKFAAWNRITDIYNEVSNATNY